MYRITYIHKDSEIENPLYIAGDQDYCLTDGNIDRQMGMAGELNVYIPEINPARYDIDCLTDEVVVYRNEKEIWRGRPVTVQGDFDLTGHLICEGVLAYLYDTYFEPFEFEGSPKEFLTWVVENHNSHVEPRKQFVVGDVTVIDNNDYISRSSIYYDRSLTVLTEKLINDSLGGYFRVRVEDGVKYLDYLQDYATQATQMVEYGENILDIATEVEYSDLATVILPLGARLEDEDGVRTDEYTTIASVNGGSIYYEDPVAVEEYGWICVCVEWEDVTIPDNLLTKAKAYLEQVTSAVRSFTVNAVDLSLISEDYEAIDVGDYVYVRSEAHGVNQYIELTEMKNYFLTPEDDVLQFGGDTATLTDSQRSSDRAVQTAIGSLSMRVTNLTASVINAVYANIETIVSSMITTDVIQAAVAELGFVTAEWVEANFANIQYLETNYATIVDLETAFANVELLSADVANIQNVLAGNVGTGDLQTIVLTADNAIIDEAIIVNALMGTVLADIITSNVIYTDYIKIANNEDQSLWIDGSTLQFRDGNGIVRVQIGLDASGNYNYYLWDAEGNLIWDPMGLTEAGLTGNGAIIKNAAVADDANISAYKLNIEELTSVLNDNGQLVLSAEQVTIGGGTLDYALTEITQQISELEAMGIDSIENWYAVSTSPDYYPPLEEDPDESAVLGEAVLGLMVLGETGEFQWTTEQPDYEEGKYIWWRQKYTYVDGTVIWTEPALWTDDYLRNAIVVQQTELEVVQGQIQAKIWETDIDDAISDQYAIITAVIDAIDLRVGTLTTTVDTLDSQVTAITIDLDGITEQVREVSEKALIDGVPYYAVSDSPDYYPPFEWDDDESAVLGEAILGLMVLGVGGINWTTEQPEYAEGQYVWLAFLRTRVDGSTYWTEPILLTDEYLRENATEMSEKYSEITMTVEGIREEVVNVQTDLALNYSTTTEIKAVIDAEVSDSSATILQTVEYNYVDNNTFDTEMSAMSSAIYQYVDGSFANLTLAVSGGSLGSTASIILTSGESQTTADIDLTNVRQAFADDKSEILISAGTITFSSNSLIIDSDNCKLNAKGSLTCYDATISGTLTAESGENKIVLGLGALNFYYNDALGGKIAPGYYGSDTSSIGIAIGCGTNAKGIYIGKLDSDTAGSDVSSAYIVNFGANPDGYTERNIFQGTIRALGTIYLSSNLQINNGYGVRSYTSDGTAVDLMFVAASNDVLYVGNTTTRTYLRGNYIYLGNSLYLNSYRIYVDDTYYLASSTAGGVRCSGTISSPVELIAGSSYWSDYLLSVYGSAICLGDWYTASDESLKEGIKTLAVKGSVVDGLTPVSFRYKEGGKTHYGLTYQNVCEALEAAGEDPDESALVMMAEDDNGNKTGAIAYQELISLLIHEIQQLKAELHEMKGVA